MNYDKNRMAGYRRNKQPIVQAGSIVKPAMRIASDLWINSTDTTKVASLLTAVRIPSTPSRLPPRIRMRLPMFRKACALNGMPCAKIIRIASISPSGIGKPIPRLPTNPLTPVARSTGIRDRGFGGILTKAYCGNSGSSTNRRRSLHWRFSPNNGRKTLTPFSRSSAATFFSCRGRVWIANQENSGFVDGKSKAGAVPESSEL